MWSVVLLAAARPARAQDSTAGSWRLDRLQVSSLGAFVGRIQPSQLDPATMVGVSADYGAVAPRWHLVFGFSFWQSQFERSVVQAFVDSLQKSVIDSTGDARVAPSAIPLYDATIGVEARYEPRPSGFLSPYAGIGIAAHVINAEGQLIKGTFVERSLDNIAAGFFVDAGVSMRLVKHFAIQGCVRGDLLSGFRSTQVRLGGMYYFGHVRGTLAPH